MIFVAVGMILGWRGLPAAAAEAERAQPVEDRLLPSVVAAVLAAQQGAAIVRVHDVAATRSALSLIQAVAQASAVAPLRAAGGGL